MVQPSDYRRWLDPEIRQVSELNDVLEHGPGFRLGKHPVSHHVNRAASEGPELIEAVAAQPENLTLF